MEALIVAGGNTPQKSLVQKIAKGCQLIIGADKGCNYIANSEVVPDYIVGDFDSANEEVINNLVEKGSIKVQYKAEKDSTDSEIAFNLAIEKGADIINLLAVTGTRLDHSFGNFGLLKKGLAKGVEVRIVDDNNTVFLINKKTTLINKAEYKYISFLAYDGVVESLSIKGAKYNLECYKLEVGDSRTVSNEFNENDIHIDMNSGNLLVIYSKD